MSTILEIAKELARAEARRLDHTNHVHAITHMDNEPMTAKDWREFDDWLSKQDTKKVELDQDKKYLTWVDEQYERMEQEKLAACLQWYEDEVQDRWGYGDAEGLYSEKELNF